MASAVIGALRVNLGIDSAEFQNGLKKAQSSLGGIGKSMQSAGKSMSAFITAPLAAMGSLTVKTAGDFEASMNRVQAATNASSQQFEQMQKMALDLGANTSKSASEAADSMEMLAKNGVSAEDILNGAAAASIKLSEATGGDLSTAADVATNVMSQFKIEVKDLGKVVDGITNVTLASQFGFQDYKDALGQAGGVAGSLGVSLQEFNAAIAATSSVFNSGSDAGTSFKTFLTTLVPKSAAAENAMKGLGLEFFNTDGSMKSIAAIAEELKTSLAGLSDEAKNEALHEIFGTDAMRTAIALADQGAAGIEKMTETVSRAGAANEQSAARMKGFNGEMEKLSGALETLSINIATSGLLAFATSLVSSLAGVVAALSQTSPELLKWGTVIAGVAAALGPLVIAVGLFVTAAAAISAPVLATVAAIAAVAAGITVLYQGLQLAMPFIQQLAGDVWARITAGVESAKQAFVSFKDSIAQLGNDIIAAFQALPAKMMEIGGQIIDGLWNGIKAKWETVKAGVAGIGTSISDSVKNALGIHSPSRVMHEVGVNVMQGLSNGMTSLKGQVLGVAGQTAEGVTSAMSSLDQLGQTLGSSIGDVFSGFIEGGDAAKEALKALVKQLASFALNDGLKALSEAFGGGSGTSGSGSSGGGGLGSVLGSVVKSLFGFSQGGSILPGGGSSVAGVDSQVVAFRKKPSERVDVYDPKNRRSTGGSVRGGDIVIQGDASENTVRLIRQALKENNRQIGYAQQNTWRS